MIFSFFHSIFDECRQQEAIDFVVKVCAKLNLGGRVRVAREGFNATLSGGADALREFARSLGDFDIHFKKTDFKYIDGLDSSKHFKDLKVVPVEELVFYGVRPEDGVKLGKGLFS